MMHKLFVDINVVLDVALERKPHLSASQQVLSQIARKSVTGHCSALSYPFQYLSVKFNDHKQAQKVLDKFDCSIMPRFPRNKVIQDRI